MSTDLPPIAVKRRRSSDITARILEIDALLTKGKLDFATGGKGHSLRERATLEAERAELRQERHGLHEEIEEIRNATKAQSQGAFIAVLCAELEDRGLHEVIRAARAKLAIPEEQTDGA